MKFLTFTLSLVFGLVSFASANPVPAEGGITLPRAPTCEADVGGMCAGFAGIACCAGLECVDVPPPPIFDGAGHCERCATKDKTCAGIAAIKCCPGLKCVNIPAIPDGAGHCANCEKEGDICGGFAGTQCCDGLKCDMVPNADYGYCKYKKGY